MSRALDSSALGPIWSVTEGGNLYSGCPSPSVGQAAFCPRHAVAVGLLDPVFYFLADCDVCFLLSLFHVPLLSAERPRVHLWRWSWMQQARDVQLNVLPGALDPSIQLDILSSKPCPSFPRGSLEKTHPPCQAPGHPASKPRKLPGFLSLHPASLLLPVPVFSLPHTGSPPRVPVSLQPLELSSCLS